MEDTLNLDKYKAVVQGLRQAELVGVDTETTGLDLHRDDYLQGMSFSYKVGGATFSEYLPVGHPDKENNVPLSFFQEVVYQIGEKPTVFHNRKFDLHSFASIGIGFPAEAVSYDTMLLAQLLNENRPYDKSLESCAQHYLKRGKVEKDEVKSFAKVFGWDAIPSTLMRNYAIGDSEVTLDLAELLILELQRKFGDDLFKTLWKWEQDMQDALFRMESTGIHVDQKFCRQYAGIADIEMSTIEYDLGFKPSKTTALAKFLFDDLELPILNYTPGGKPAMDKAVMEEYERMLEITKDDRARQVLDYRGWQKASSSFYLPFQNLADSEGKIHCNYKQHGTTTGRLSCTHPNLQQIPRQSDKAWNGRIRTAFRASEGYSLVGFDYSQLELRLAAAYGQEQWLIEEFSKPEADVFTALAERIGTDRYTAKTFTYAMIYGAGLEKIAKTLTRTVGEIEEAYANFQASIPGVIRVKRQVEQRIKRRGYVRYWSGRRRNLYPDAAYKGFNSLLQGGGAEVVKHVLVKADKEICDDNCRLLLQIHDELVFEIRDGMVDKYSYKIVKLMQEYPTEIFEVPFAVAGHEWGEAS